jgi:2-phospho-L-lactate guanylyltransferase
MSGSGSGSVGGCWALVPVKPLRTAKSRLAEVLSDAARERLARDLLTRTLGVLSGARGLSGVAAVSRDPEVSAIAAAHGALPLGETSSLLDAIIDGGLDALRARGASSALVVLSDLPELLADDLARMIEVGARYPLVIAPDARDEGTNALFIAPPDRMRTCFGRQNSFRAHQERAASLGIEAAVLRAPSLAFDLDTADDYARFSAARSG